LPLALPPPGSTRRGSRRSKLSYSYVNESRGQVSRASNALLVGNLADGFINAFNPTTGKFIGQSAVPFQGLWALIFGDGRGFNGQTNQLFLSSGPDGYSEGLFTVVNVK
jgi:hypothetical protein